MKLKHLLLLASLSAYSILSAFNLTSYYGEDELNINIILDTPELSVSDIGNATLYSDGFSSSDISRCEKNMRRIENFYIPSGMAIDNMEVAAMIGTLPINGGTEDKFKGLYVSLNSDIARSFVSIKDVELYRNLQIGRISIHPFKYDNNNEIIHYCKKLDIRIKFQKQLDGEMGFVNIMDIKRLNELVSIPCLQFINNNERDCEIEPSALPILPLWDVAPRMLIITPSEFTSEAERYASVKRRLGYSITILELPSSTLCSVNRVYDAIKDVYDEVSNLEYVLLMGNGDKIASYMGTWPQVWDTSKYGNSNTRFYYSDFHYSCMDGTYDYIPDICVGRFPANTIEELTIMINKSLQYECNPPVEQDDYFKTISLCSEFKGRDTYPAVEESYFIYTSEFIKDNLINHKYGFDEDVNCVYYSNPSVFPQRYYNYEIIPEYLRTEYDWNKSPSDFENVFNDGSSIIGMRGHGHNTTWSHAEFKNYNASRLRNNGMYPIVFGMSCLIGNFYNPNTLPQGVNCLAHTMLINPTGGAVGVFAPASDSYSGYNDILYANLFDAIYPGSMAFFYIPEIGGIPGNSENPYTVIGRIINRAKIRSFNSFDHSDDNGKDYLAYVTRETYNWLGDPSIKIFKSKPIRREVLLDLNDGDLKLYDDRTLVAVGKNGNVTFLPQRVNGAYDLKNWSSYNLSLIGEGFIPEMIDVENIVPSTVTESKITTIKSIGDTFVVEYQSDVTDVKVSSYSIYGEKLSSVNGEDGRAYMPNNGTISIIVLEVEDKILDKKTVK